MYNSHPDIVTPEDSTTIWRYLDITKFLSLITDRSLYFCRADHFDDKWEGVYTAFQNFDQLAHWPNEEARVDQMRWFFEVMARARAATFLSCWHAQQDENAAMWEIYSARSSGLAIRSTVGRLKAAIEQSSFPVYIGRVEYGNENPQPVHDLTLPFFVKQREYKFECEVRALLWSQCTERSDRPRLLTDPVINAATTGIRYPTDLERLTESIVVSPRAGPHVVDLVRSILNQYSYESIDVQPSRLTMSPPSVAEWNLKEPRVYSLKLDLYESQLVRLLEACREYNEQHIDIGPQRIVSVVQQAAKAAGFSGADAYLPKKLQR